MYRYLRCNRRYGRSILAILTLFVLSNFLVSMKTTNPTRAFGMMNFHGVFVSTPTTDPVIHMLNRKPYDHELIDYVRSHFTKHFPNDPYNFTNYQHEDQSPNQCSRIDNYLGKKEYGIFVDIGSGDGEQNSVSLFFERWRNWTGLLVEENPVNYQKLKMKKRKADTLNACVKATVNHTDAFVEKHGIKIPCLWIETILKSYLLYNREIIDLLIINISDQSADILRSIPFKKLKIRIVTVSFPTYHFPTIDKITQHMIGQKYIALHQFIGGSNDNRRTDIIYVTRLNFPVVN